jgi:uncharacterized RDD family membrane protein YckC
MGDDVWEVDLDASSSIPRHAKAGWSEQLASMEPAPVWRRAVAWFLDTIALFVLFVVSIQTLLETAPMNASLNHFVMNSMGLISVLVPSVTGLLYFVSMTASPLQATLGKLLVGIKVCSVDEGRPSFLAVVVREVLKYPCLFLHGVTHGADISRSFTRERRTSNRYSYDVLSKTAVILARRRAR